MISLASPYLSPGLVSFVGTQNLSISGNGNINNNGSFFGLNSSLLVNGTGSLAISNANTYAGGTTISNGYLIVDTFNGALGSGPVTLAGGILRLGVSGASVANMITNNFIVTATSTVQYDGTGGNAFNFGGTLTGSAGQTLSFSNNTIAATLNWVRLTKGFTNNANILLTSPGAAVEFAPVLNGGDQIYNGTISGDVGRVRPGGGNGSAIFNAQNTYNDSGDFAPSGISLYMTGGNAGFGADSTASSPPTIDASPAGTGDIGIDVRIRRGAFAAFLPVAALIRSATPSSTPAPQIRSRFPSLEITTSPSREASTFPDLMAPAILTALSQSPTMSWPPSRAQSVTVVLPAASSRRVLAPWI